MQQVMKWATDIYKDSLQPADTLTWTGSGNNENFIAKNIAQTSNGPSITFALENALAKATDAKEKKTREEALANHVALPHPGGPDGRRMQAICMSFGIFKNSKDPEAAMSLIAHLLSPEETVRVMKDSYGQFAPVLDKARAASKDYFNKNENYRTFGRAAEWFAATGWPGPGDGGRRRGAGEQRADRRAGQGHRRQVVGGPGHRLGRQEDQGNLRHLGDRV